MHIFSRQKRIQIHPNQRFHMSSFFCFALVFYAYIHAHMCVARHHLRFMFCCYHYALLLLSCLLLMCVSYCAERVHMYMAPCLARFYFLCVAVVVQILWGILARFLYNKKVNVWRVVSNKWNELFINPKSLTQRACTPRYNIK